MALIDKLTAIADGFRASRGTTQEYTLDEMAVLAAEEVGGGGGDIDALIDGSITEITSNAGSVRDHAFYNYDTLTTVNFPAATIIGSNAFYGCSVLKTVAAPNVTELKASAFEYCKQLSSISLHDGVNYIRAYAFEKCAMTEVRIPASALIIEYRAFGYCDNLVEVTFAGTPSVLGNAFSGSYNINTINVPWAEGEVANAPWGATNATINYNYTGG